MTSSIIRNAIIGLYFCIAQSLVEAILAYFLAIATSATTINFEGGIMYAFIRLILTGIPYVVIFCIALHKASKILSSIISFGLNLGILCVFLYVGLIKNEAVLFIIASVLTSIIFIVVDQRMKLTKIATGITNASA